ncbi:hypothetical protein EVAR_74993_1 [Eumeta japonica]|uniref:Uncharacterized protein n=1 Tax=Eumeta variegata TaxID=151549 RepID=A0A4C1V9S5_EUMVA|nr:hypothetical protein EVAR_74993_1 [Eumeta japonica]
MVIEPIPQFVGFCLQIASCTHTAKRQHGYGPARNSNGQLLCYVNDDPPERICVQIQMRETKPRSPDRIVILGPRPPRFGDGRSRLGIIHRFDVTMAEWHRERRSILPCYVIRRRSS